MNVKVIVPNTFKVGALTFRLVNNESRLKLTECRASTSMLEQVVRLPGSKVTSEHATVLLFHEVWHIIEDIRGKDYDEETANMCSNFLVEFLTSLGIVFDFSNIKEETCLV